MKRKSSVLLSSSIFPICKAAGKKRIRCFAGQCAIPNSFLLYCFNTNKAKRFILRLVVRDPWPLFKPRRLKRSIGRFFVPKLSLRKRKSLWVIRLITQLWQKQFLNFTMIFPHWHGHAFRTTAFRVHIKTSFDSIVSLQLKINYLLSITKYCPGSCRCCRGSSPGPGVTEIRYTFYNAECIC